MSKKIYINSNLERLFSYAITLLMILGLNIILAKTLLKRIQAAAESDFIEKCDDQAEDFALAVNTKLQQIESRLDLFYAKIAYKDFSSTEIRNLIIKEKDNIHAPFDLVVYADKNGTSWNTFGEEFSVTDRRYYQKIISGESKFYVTNVLESKHDGSACVIFARPVYDSAHEISGILFATCPVSELSKYIEGINMAHGKKFAIRDDNKRFIYHSDPKWINWVYSPWKYKDKIFSTPIGDFYVKESTGTDGTDVYVFYKAIEAAPWTIALSIPKEDFTKISKEQKVYHNFIIEIIIISLSLILLLETWVHKMLEKHQILSTHIDSLTHLWVRSYFEKEANKLIKRYPKSKFILIECDIRGFKFINQNYGETQANKLLLQFSKRIYETTKQFDGILCRGYADHFFVFIKINSVHSAMKQFKIKLKSAMENSKKNEIPFIPKFGLSFYLPNKQDDSPSIQILISRASFAKSTIKENALQQFAIYDEKLLQKSKNENFIETHMETALANKEFFVMYQPKIDLATEKVVGAEALVRWQSPKLGFMPPNSFVPLFERNNFIVKLDFYVYEEVFKFIRRCMDKGEPTVPISVNVSRNHDKPDKFVHAFTGLLKKYNITPSQVEVELLERATLDKNLLREITIMLQKEGFKVAMDDFGSGESSLNMLSSIPVNILKFDRSFLFANDAVNGRLDETAESFIQTLVVLGKNLKKQTIFEGVETEEQRDFLRKIKCDQVQGYFYSKPLREDEFIQFLKKRR